MVCVWSPPERCSQVSHRRSTSESRPACSPYTCRSLRSLCDPRSPAARYPASDLYRTYRNQFSASCVLFVVSSSSVPVNLTYKWFLSSAGTGDRRWSRLRKSCRRKTRREGKDSQQEGSDGVQHVGCCAVWREYIRGSVRVELVAVLDVEHEISSIQILHHEEQVLLDTDVQRGQSSERMSTGDFWAYAWSLPSSGRCSKGVWGKGFPRLKRGPSSPPWCTPRHRPSAPRLSSEPSPRRTARFSSARLKTPGNAAEKQTAITDIQTPRAQWFFCVNWLREQQTRPQRHARMEEDISWRCSFYLTTMKMCFYIQFIL